MQVFELSDDSVLMNTVTLFLNMNNPVEIN